MGRKWRANFALFGFQQNSGKTWAKCVTQCTGQSSTLPVIFQISYAFLPIETRAPQRRLRRKFRQNFATFDPCRIYGRGGRRPICPSQIYNFNLGPVIYFWRGAPQPARRLESGCLLVYIVGRPNTHCKYAT